MTKKNKKTKKTSTAHMSFVSDFVSTIGALEIANFPCQADTQRYFIFSSASSICVSAAAAKGLSSNLRGCGE